MPIPIKLPPELEEKLLESASEAGMDVNQYVLEILEGQLRHGASKGGEKAERESELLQKITLGIPDAIWKRYDYLQGLREREQLDPEELAELIRISDQMEKANAERMKYLVELAKLRNVSLRGLMLTLGIKPGVNA